ncbi:uncharacterized protein G2W53_043586 [Senna tora]|uniref:Uncharacterized protein n=1 Tax=Senna tora TaxID=362788 RepID=A0A834SHA3_9FABA|nr:uncharacterized protein G2W53_043586 [Senna tora]
MADHSFLCIIGVMDRLWFHQIVLFSEPTASVALKPISECQSCPSLPPPPDEVETSTHEPPCPEKQVLSGSISLTLQETHDHAFLSVFHFYCHKDDSNKEEEIQERTKKMNLLGNRIRSHSSSPLTSNRLRKFRKLATTARRLQKSMSCRTMGELELEEVKGFMDLGFVFKKENVNPQMMIIVPGLQRLSMHQNKQNMEVIDAKKTVEDDDVEKREEKREISISRPYLSEAWLIKRPDSQLLNLKIPRLCSASDMKKHLRFWAKTVALEIHQE